MKNLLLYPIIAGIFFFASACSGTTKNESQEPAITQSADAHTSQISLDWDGTYSGILPCADCEGIETVIRLNKDNSFSFSQKYLGKETTQGINTSGTFTWTADGNKIILSITNNNRMFQVGENKLTWLDNDGNKITGNTAANYVLQKQ